MTVNHRDFAAGALFIAIGAFFSINAWLTLRIGVAQEMGPGYFPILLGAVLICFGFAIALSAAGKATERFGRVSWRGVGLVTASIIFFAVTLRGLGLAPALVIATILAGLASGRLSVRGVAVLAVSMTAFCVAVFIYALRLPYPVIGPWLGG